MSLAVVGQGASYEFRWRRWALLQDTVAANYESGRSGSKYPQLEAIGTALAAGSVHIAAAELAREVDQIRAAMRGQPIDLLRISARTASVLYPTAHAGYRALSSVELSRLTPVGDAKDLTEYFASMLDSLSEVCAKPAADGTIEVLDG